MNGSCPNNFDLCKHTFCIAIDEVISNHVKIIADFMKKSLIHNIMQ